MITSTLFQGKFDAEVAPITISGKSPITIATDEEFNALKLDKVPSLKAAFKKDGTVTAANASKLSDGAAAMIIMSGKAAREHRINPLFRIRGYGKFA